MKNVIKKNISIIAAALCMFSLFGCEQAKSNENVATLEKFDENIVDLGAWTAYWQIDVSDEIKELDSKLTSMSYFEAYFDGNNNIVIPDELQDYYDETKGAAYEKYITIVNDKVISEDNTSLKDVELLSQLLKDEKSVDKHINDIIDIAKQYNFNGIEIDYEQIKDDMSLWESFIDFSKKLYKKTEEENLKLRIVLEPSIPYKKLNFIEGPEYVMMCYNLHGSGSEPGEKANPDFIQKVIDDTKNVPGSKKYAVATGGIDWEKGQKGVSIDEKKAEELLVEFNANATRDKKSGCLVFEYTDQNKKKHEVWYADKFTLNEWMKVIYKNGYTASLWKLGGNSL